MIIEINKDNINLLKNSFINKEQVLNELTNNPFAKVIAFQKDNRITGYLYYSDIYDRIEINQFEVLKEYRGHGIGSLLLKEVLKQEKNITLEVKQTNTLAINLYKKYGFREVAKRKGYYNGIDGILMIYEKK